MLEKVIWRTIKEPQSLLYQTLVGKYWCKTNFLDSLVLVSISHGWRGIFAGREVLRHGLEWVVGNGLDINMWIDQWLCFDKPALLSNPTRENMNLRVKDLRLTSSSLWNFPTIKKYLSEYENIIKEIISSDSEMSSELVWLRHKSRVYMTKSGYANSDSEENYHFNWKKQIWQVNTRNTKVVYLQDSVQRKP